MCVTIPWGGIIPEWIGSAFARLHLVWIRLLGAPWWQRFLAHWCVAAIAFGLIVPLATPHLTVGLRWPWRLTFLVFAAALFAGLAVVAGRRASREYVTAMRGLNRSERAQAVTASLRGDIPTATPVLVSAIRIGTIRLGHGRSTPKRVAISYGALILGWIALTAGNASTEGVRQTAFRGVLTAVVAIAGLRAWFVARRAEERITLLQNALELIPGAADEFRAARSGEPAGRYWWPTVASVTAVVLVTTGTLATVYLARRPSPDCRAAANVERFIVEHRDMLEPTFISPDTGGPELADYQSWSEQLERYASSVSVPSVASHIHSVAVLSARAVAVARAARADPAGWHDPSQERRRHEYGGIIGEMMTELRALEGSCPPRR